jgi:gliding motility-associated-like protein
MKTMNRIVLLLSFALGSLALPAQTPFVCDGDFFLSLGTSGSNTGFYRVQTDTATGQLVFNGFSPGNNSGARVNAMGYRVTDNLIYGVHPDGNTLYQIGADGIAVSLGDPGINNNYNYVAGDVTPDGNFLVVLGHANNISSIMVKIDLTSGTYNATQSSLFTTGSGNVFTADMTIDPFTGTIYGFDATSDRLITIDMATGTLDNTTYPQVASATLLGAMYFDAFGDLHGYGRPAGGGNSQNTFYDLDINTGAVTAVATGPSANSNDGCSCPFTIEMDHWASPSLAKPCDTVDYYIVVANNSGGDKPGLDLIMELPAGLIIDQILTNPFPGNMVSGVGSSLLRIENATIPVGIDTLIMSVVIEPLPISTPVMRSQARLVGVPPALGDSVFSDDPFTPPSPDSTSFYLSADTLVLPTQFGEYCQGDSLQLDASSIPANEWIWSNGTIGPTTVVDQPGTYYVFAVECSVLVDSFVVTELPLPPVTAHSDTAVCLGEQVLFQANGAVSYEWYKVGGGNLQGTGPALTPTPGVSTDYLVIGTDAKGCQASDTVRATVRPLPMVDAGADLALCYYEQIQVGSSNNDPSHSFAWSNGLLLADSNLMQPQFVHAVPGQYQLTLVATDTFGCQQSDQMWVTVHDLQLNVSTQDVDCFGNDNGAATVSVVGQPQFTYFWTDDLGLPLANGLQNNPNISIQNLEPGQYQNLVIDGNGCVDSIGFSITQPAAPLSSVILNSQDVDCFGNANGSIEVGGQGGTAPYEYSIDGGFNYQSVGLFTGLGGSNYTVQTRDANGCLTTISDTISSPTGLFGNVLAKRNIDCFGANNGGLTLFGSGGTPPYALTLDGINYVNGLSLSNLAPGIDTVSLVDNNGCQVAIPFEIFEPPALLGTAVYQRNIDCFGHATGELALSGSGGSFPYLFSLDGQTFQSDSFFLQLTAGTYAAIVQDDSLCQTVVPVTLTEPSALTLTNLYQENVDCFGNATGEVVVGGVGGTAPYLYQFDTLSFQAANQFGNLPAGDYAVFVEDDSACQAQLVVSIAEPPLLTLDIGVQANVACFGESTGFVDLAAAGGTPAYTYSQDSLLFGSSPLFPNLSVGTYQFWVRDDSNCLARVETEITEPEELQLTKVELQQIDCFGHDNGQVEATVTGGVMSYRYSLDGQNWQPGSRFSLLPPGTYQLWIQDDSACVVNYPFEITEPPLLVATASHTDVSCFDFADGTAAVAVEGGTPGYEYLWKTVPNQYTSVATGLPGGQYSVRVWDQNGCEARDTVDIFEPALLTLELLPGSIVEAYCDWANGEAAVVSDGGLQPHDIRWEGPNIREGYAATDLLGGDYVVSVTDRNGCVTTLPVFIPDTPPAVARFETLPSYEDSILLSDAQILFDNQSIGAAAFHWDFGDGGMSDAENPVWHYQETGVFPVRLTAYNSYFVCPTDTTVFLHIIPDGDVFIPSAFSPNDDGINDLFFLGGEGLVSYELQIFNRWGERLKVIQSLSEGWDGTNARGLPVPEGVYVYHVKALLNDGSEVDRGGTITLIR